MQIDNIKKYTEECRVEGDKVCILSKFHDVFSFFINQYSCEMLKSITAVDLGTEIELIYNLYSFVNDEDVILSQKVKDSAESVVDLFESARADENEIYDMFGIKFIGNDDLKRLYMPENWKGHPLRKDYVQDDTRLAWNDDTDNA